MSLTMRQRQRLRAGRLCITLPRARSRLDDATKFDISVVVGALCVLAVGLWLGVPLLQDAVLMALSGVVVTSAIYILVCAFRAANEWARGGDPENSDTAQ